MSEIVFPVFVSSVTATAAITPKRLTPIRRSAEIVRVSYTIQSISLPRSPLQKKKKNT